MRNIRWNMNGCNRQGSRGFTLIELLIVIAILGILAAIAFPNYTAYMQKSRRSDGKALLMDIAARQEQYFLDNKTYTDDLTKLGYAADPAISEKGFYSVAVDPVTFGPAAFKLIATPQGVQSGDKCTTLTLDEKGTKDFTPTTAANCW